MSLFGSMGLVQKDELLNRMRSIIHKALSMDAYDLKNVFYRAYGVNGLFYSDVDEEVTAPIVIVKREDLTRLIAAEKVLSYYKNGDYKEEIKRKQKEIETNYLRATGMSQSDIDRLSKLFDKNN